MTTIHEKLDDYKGEIPITPSPTQEKHCKDCSHNGSETWCEMCSGDFKHFEPALPSPLTREELIKGVKEVVAKRHCYPDNILGTSWEYAMQLTHRTKAQSELYEEVLVELSNNQSPAKEVMDDDILKLFLKYHKMHWHWEYVEKYGAINHEDFIKAVRELLTKKEG